MLQKFILFLSATLLLSACSSNLSLMKRRYTKGYYVSSTRHNSTDKHAVELKKSPAKPQPVADSSPAAETAVANAPAEVLNIAPVEKSGPSNSAPAAPSKKASSPETAPSKTNKKTEAVSAIQSLTDDAKQEKSRESAKASSDAKLIIMVILSLFIFINLIAIYMHDDDITLNFWITLILDFTIIGGI